LCLKCLVVSAPIQSTIVLLRCCCSRFLCLKCLVVSAPIQSISYIFVLQLIIAVLLID